MLRIRGLRTQPTTFDETAHKIRAVIASEEPVLMPDYQRWEMVNEVLLMSGMIVPDNGQVPFLNAHDRSDIEDVLGSVREFAPVGTTMEADVYFDQSKDGMECESKVRGGHLTDLSAGYEPIETIYIPEKTSQIVDGKSFTGPMNVVRKWKLKEVSAVPIGADENAKFRSEKFNEELFMIAQKVRAGLVDEMKVRGIMDDVTKDLLTREAAQEMFEKLINQNPKPHEERIHIMEPIKATPEELAAFENTRKASIEQAAKDFGGRIKGGEKRMATMAKDAITLGVPFELFRGEVFKLVNDCEPLETTASEVGMSRSDIQKYSISRAILSLHEKENSFEREISQQIETNMRNSAKPEENGFKRQGLLVPREIRMMGLRQFQQRAALNTGTASEGGDLVATNLVPSEFVPLLRSRLLRQRLGIRYLTGVKGNFSIPKQTAAGTFAFTAQGVAPSESELAVGQVDFTPKEGAAFQKYTRRLLAQSTPGVDMLVNEDLNMITELGWEYAMFHGAGGTEPIGVEATSGIGAVDAGTAGRAAIVEFETDIAAANADIGSQFTVMNAASRGLMKTRPEQTVAGFSRYLIENNRMNDYPVEVTNNVDNGFVFHGVWAQSMMADWDVYDLIVNPYSEDTAGIIKVSIRTIRDFNVLQPSAFTMSNNLS